MKTKLMPILAACALALAGCVTNSQIQSRDAGPKPTQAQVEPQARVWFETTLKDPYSAHIEFLGIYKGWYSDGPFAGGIQTGWVAEYSVNAKNSFGGYTGYQTHYLFFRDGQFVREITLDRFAAQMAHVWDGN